LRSGEFPVFFAGDVSGSDNSPVAACSSGCVLCGVCEGRFFGGWVSDGGGYGAAFSGQGIHWGVVAAVNLRRRAFGAGVSSACALGFDTPDATAHRRGDCGWLLLDEMGAGFLFCAGNLGIWSGLATMLANAAGPVMALYFLALDVPKFVLVGTSAWFFLIVNVLKVPFSANLGLITKSSLLFNLVLCPAVALGIYAGRSLIRVIPQKLFEFMLLFFATLASLRLMGIL
jgi:hypothetical protein